MRILLLSLITTSLFFKGCDDPEPPKKEYIYVKTKVPKQYIFKKPQRYEITDYSKIDEQYTKVRTNQLRNASNTSQQKDETIRLDLNKLMAQYPNSTEQYEDEEGNMQNRTVYGYFHEQGRSVVENCPVITINDVLRGV